MYKKLNPLGTILSGAKLLRQPQLNQKTHVISGAIEYGANRLIALVNDTPT